MIDEKAQKINQINPQAGQSLVEFLLLMALVMIVSMSFLSLVNSGVAKYWTSIANAIHEGETIKVR